MTDDLANQLRQRASKQLAATPVSLLEKAAEHIEELEDHLASMAGLWAKSDSEKQLLLGRIEELEAENAQLKQMWWDAGDVTDLAGTIADLKAERDALKEAVDEVTEYAKRHEAERDALAQERDDLAALSGEDIQLCRQLEMERDEAVAERDALAEKLAMAVEALEDSQDEIDDYIRREYPGDHPVHERYRARDFEANPARVALASIKETPHD